MPVAARHGEGPPARRRPRRGRGAGRRGRARGDAARPERQLLRRRVRRPARVRQAAAGLRRDRRARAGAVHLAAPEGLHRRRHRRDGRDAERHAVAAHAAAVRLRPGAQGDAPVLPARALPRHHRPGPRRDAGRRDHHRHHRRLPRRDRGGLRADAATSCARPGSPARSRSSTPSARARRPPTMPDQVPKEVVQERYERLVALQEEISWAENKQPGRPDARGAGRRGRGPQGRRHAPAVRPRARQPARALRGPAGRRRRRARATSRRSRSPTPRRTTWSPTARFGGVRRTRAGDAWAGPPGSDPTPPACCSACRAVGAPAPAACRRHLRLTCSLAVGVLVAAAVCPHPPLLVPGVAAGAAGELDALRARLRRGRRRPAPRPTRPRRGGRGRRRGRAVPRRRLGQPPPYGVRVPVGAGDGPPDPAAAADHRPLAARPRRSRPLPAAAVRRRPDAGADRCAALGAELAARADRVALLVMGDGSARRSLKGPGELDPEPRRSTPRSRRRCAAGDPAALAASTRTWPPSCSRPAARRGRCWPARPETAAGAGR